VNPVRQLHVDSHWDAMCQSAAMKAPEEGFGRLFNTARSEMEQPMRVQYAERKPGQQERLEREVSDRMSREVDNSEDKLLNETDELRDRVPSDMDPDDSVEVGDQDPAAVQAATGETEAVPVVNAAIVDKVIQSSGQANTAVDVATKGQQIETSVVNSGLNVRNQNLEAAELIGQQNQAKGESKGQGNGLSGETVNMAKQLFAEEDGDEAAKVIKQGNAVSKEASGVQATGPQSNREVSDQRINHLEVLHKTTQDQSAIIREHELNASTKGEQQKAQTLVTPKAVMGGNETVGNDQAFSGQGLTVGAVRSRVRWSRPCRIRVKARLMPRLV